MGKKTVRYQAITTYEVEVEADTDEEAIANVKSSINYDHKEIDYACDYFEVVGGSDDGDL